MTVNTANISPLCLERVRRYANRCGVGEEEALRSIVAHLKSMPQMESRPQNLSREVTGEDVEYILKIIS